jgi:hypothetical protein
MSKRFSLGDVAFLTSDAGQNLLSQLANEDLSDAKMLSLVPKLRSKYTPDQTSAAIETLQLRRKAVGKFGADAHKMLFTSDALQQASHPAVRAWRARKWSGATVDVCCSIGTDTIAFARAGHETTGVDIDPVRIVMAGHNAVALGVKATFVNADVTKGEPPDCDSLFYDPSRRDEHGNRIYNVEKYIPPLNLVHQWRQYADVTVKLSPGVNIDQLQQYGGQLTFISVDGDLKEAQFALVQPASCTALLLSSDNGVHQYVSDATFDDKEVSEPRQWLCEPDPAIIRAGYVANLANDLNGTMLDETIAYFTTEPKPISVWVRSWEILDWMPFNLKRLRAYLRSHNIGRVTVKKRGSPLTPEGLISKLKLKGSESRTLVLTRLRGEPIVLVCADYVE